MVKNTQGGNRAKKQARKNTVPLDESMVKARFSTDPDEIYACCAQLLGNGMCHVMCVDGQKRICVIRNKFRGKGKRGNILSVGTWCLVGRRDFEKPKEGKLEKTDLLEVYGDIEKKKIIQKEIALKDQWKLFNAYDSSIHNVANYDEDVSFTRTTDFEEPGLNSMYSDDENGGMGSPHPYQTEGMGSPHNEDGGMGSPHNEDGGMESPHNENGGMGSSQDEIDIDDI